MARTTLLCELCAKLPSASHELRYCSTYSERGCILIVKCVMIAANSKPTIDEESEAHQ